METVNSLYGLIGTVLLAGISGFVALKTAKRGGQAGEDAERIERGVGSVEGWMQLSRGLVERLNSVEAAQKDSEAKVEKLSKDLDFMHTWRRAALRYIMDLTNHASRHTTEPVPDPPDELVADLREVA